MITKTQRERVKRGNFTVLNQSLALEDETREKMLVGGHSVGIINAKN